MRQFSFQPLLRESVKALMLGDELSAADYMENLNKTLSNLLAVCEKRYLDPGSADALQLIGVMHMKLGSYHFSEIACLLSYRLRATLISPELYFNNLVNLCRMCLEQKSYEEAYAYGLLAEAHTNDDPDLAANLAAICALSGRRDEAAQRLDELKSMSSSHFAAISAQISGQGDFQPTHNVDCSDLAARFEHFRAHGSAEEFKNLAYQLMLTPDGKEAWRCWQIVAEVHQAAMPRNDPRQEFLMVQELAGMAAAAGKAIAFHPSGAEDEPQLWKMYGSGLGQCCLYKQAVQALEKCLSITPDDSAVLQNLTYCRRMANLPEDHQQRPDSRRFIEARRAERVGDAGNGGRNGVTVHGGGNSKDAQRPCYVATALSGSDQSWQVSVLRQFRDERLVNHRIGRMFIDWYYTWSEEAAIKLARRPWLKKMMWPLLTFLCHTIRALFNMPWSRKTLTDQAQAVVAKDSGRTPH